MYDVRPNTRMNRLVKYLKRTSVQKKIKNTTTMITVGIIFSVIGFIVGNIAANGGDIRPDNMFYTLDRFVENVELACTTDKVKKVELLMKMSQERTEEAAMLARMQKDTLAIETLKESQKHDEYTASIIVGLKIDISQTNGNDLNSKLLEKYQEHTKNNSAKMNEIFAEITNRTTNNNSNTSVKVNNLMVFESKDIENNKSAIIDADNLVSAQEELIASLTPKTNPKTIIPSATTVDKEKTVSKSNSKKTTKVEDTSKALAEKITADIRKSSPTLDKMNKAMEKIAR